MAGEFEPSPQPESAVFFHGERASSSFPQRVSDTPAELPFQIPPVTVKSGDNLSVILGRRRQATYNRLIRRR